MSLFDVYARPDEEDGPLSEVEPSELQQAAQDAAARRSSWTPTERAQAVADLKAAGIEDPEAFWASQEV